MAKPKNPLLSLGAQGTIGNALTYQRRGRGTIARKKPIPANPQSLAQMYHRWLYEDYAYLWRQQSEATKQAYRSEGATRHLTGFSQWMSEQLTDLSDIAGIWRFDEGGRAVAHDTSRNSNNGTLFGPLWVPGYLGNALLYDSVDDFVRVPANPTLDFTTAFTIETWIYPLSSGELGNGRPAEKLLSWALNMNGVGVQDIRFYIWVAGGFLPVVSVGSAASYNNWHYIAGLFDGSNVILQVDQTEFVGPVTPGPIDVNPANPLYFGSNFNQTQTFDGVVDDIILHNRALDYSERTRHSLTRYPP